MFWNVSSLLAGSRGYRYFSHETLDQTRTGASSVCSSVISVTCFYEETQKSVGITLTSQDRVNSSISFSLTLTSASISFCSAEAHSWLQWQPSCMLACQACSPPKGRYYYCYYKKHLNSFLHWWWSWSDSVQSCQYQGCFMFNTWTVLAAAVWPTRTCGELHVDTSSWPRRPCWLVSQHSSADGHSMMSSSLNIKTVSGKRRAARHNQKHTLTPTNTCKAGLSAFNTAGKTHLSFSSKSGSEHFV